MKKQISLMFLTPGLHTLVVDSSGLGQQKFGVPLGGPMDAKSAKICNWLVGNNEEAEPLLEITMRGPKIVFESDCQIAITGANISPKIDDTSVGMYQTILVKKGEIITFGKLINGCRAYLAVRGNWPSCNWLTASKTNILKEERIKIDHVNPLKTIRTSSKTLYSPDSLVVRVMKGPEFELLPKVVKKTLLNTKFTLRPESNRMGYRLNPNLSTVGKGIISSGVVPGTLQITEEGLPILLMVDAPTTGGYLRALVVISEDLANLGQLKPSDSLEFRFV